MSNNIIQFPKNNNIKPQLISEDIYKEQLLEMEQSLSAGLLGMLNYQKYFCKYACKH
jgi:hypothetical protein